MPEWLVEHGIGEDRAVLMDGDSVLAAKCRWPGELHAGQSIDAKLVRKESGTVRGVGETDDGRTILIDRLPRNAQEGTMLPLTIMRGAIAERGRYKLPAARPADMATPASDIFASARPVRRLPQGAWENVWDAASSGEIAFAGGSLLFSATPAMTLIDIDGTLPPRELALAAVAPLARALRWFDLGGSIGIDFPTIADKPGRRAVDESLGTTLTDWPHERTAINGFGFVQIVARLEGPSLLHRLATARLGAAARMALRRAERIDGAGETLLTIHPALSVRLRPEWREELIRRTGRPLQVQTDPALAIEAAHAQLVSR
ncbi:ribonuclease [Altererythrobacter sp. FM1]|uniref:ribonuclease n=1 Tax=Tsuneonella flava TaxID=2055955 RepID=UPI000C801B72|nr:ribonuclease [Tsuneonella flava]ROT93334.1 ribonuclease [Altererythrobacter sp. FM1]